MRLLVTRPEPDATRTAQALRARGHDVLVAPLLRDADDRGGIRRAVTRRADDQRECGARAARASAPWRADAASRLHGRRAQRRGRARGRLRRRRFGRRRARRSRATWSRPSVDRSARLLYLAGEDRAGDLAGDLAAHGIAVETAVIYRAVAAETLPAESDAGAAGEHARRRAALFAPQRRDAAALAGQAGALNAVLSLAHYCLSAEVAAPLREAGAGADRDRGAARRSGAARR